MREQLDEPRELMFDELADVIGQEALEADLRDAMHQRVTQLYDSQDQIEVER